MHGNAWSEFSDLLHGRLGVVCQIRLVQDDHRLGAAFLRRHEKPLNPLGVEVAIKAADEEHDVDIGRDDLLDLLRSGRTARKLRSARKYRMKIRAMFARAASDG